MDASTFPWVTTDDTVLWDLAPVPCAATTFGTGPPDFSTSVNCPMGGVANTPSFSTMAPALQGVIALNLSFVDSTGNPSAVDLDSLLAGLLDNSTGGVNGTFRDETGNLSSLGLAGPVMSALANGVWDSGGIFGAPVSYGQPNPPSPPGCNGFLGCVWNTVSGVVVGIAGAIYGAVWTAVQAATQFMKQLGAGLAHLAEVAVSAAVSALAAVGQALEAALQALLAFILSIALSMFKVVTSVLWDALSAAGNAYLSLFVNAGKAVVAYSNGAGSMAQITSAEVLAILPLLLLGITVAIVMEIVLGITAPISLAVSAIIGVFITAFLSVVIGFLLNSKMGQVLGTVSSSVSSAPSASAAFLTSLLENTMNYTWNSILGVSQTTGDVTMIGDSGFDLFGTMAFAIGAGGFASPYYTFKTAGGDVLAILGFGISVAAFAVGLLMFAVTTEGCNDLPGSVDNGLMAIAISGAILSVLSWPMDFFGIGLSKTPTNKMLAAAAFLFFDPVGFVSAGADIDSIQACQKTATPG